VVHECGDGEVFVFGSNLAGRHGAGAALTALKSYGAVLGVGEGLRGRSYALPTKDRAIRTLPLEVVELYVKNFLDFAWAHPELQFFLTRVGCGLAGYQDRDIAPLFKTAPSNVRKPEGW
jgi:hypothetical protein